MNGVLDFWLEILHAERGAVEADFAERENMVAREAARINFDAGFDVVGELKMFADDLAEAPDFVRVQKRGRAAAPVELDHLAFGVEEGRHAGDFFFEMVEVGFGLAVVAGDDGGAAAKPA